MWVYCINLERRTDKLEYVKGEFARMGIKGVEYFKAFDTKPGWRGCRDSHLAIMELCKEGEMFCVFEDDVKFLTSNELPNFFEELPLDWDCLFLGASPQEPFEQYSENLYKMGKAWTTHAIIWHNREGGAVEYILANKDRISKIDVFFVKEIYPKFNCFLTRPLVATQVQFQSDTCKRSDVSTIVTNYNKYCK